jgi:hypothetical protein
MNYPNQTSYHQRAMTNFEICEVWKAQMILPADCAVWNEIRKNHCCCLILHCETAAAYEMKRYHHFAVGNNVCAVWESHLVVGLVENISAVSMNVPRCWIRSHHPWRI